jgi:PAS domain S-box-containing protein
MDLVSCRNLLIYFQPPAQLRALVSFHFALKVDGHLLLGPSESVGELHTEFEPVDRQWKIYRKFRDSRLPLELKNGATPSSSRFPMRSPAVGDVRLSRAYEVLMHRYVPTGALVNERREVVHLFGQADRFLRPGAGRVTQDILGLARGQLRLALSAALQTARTKGERVVYSGVRLDDEYGPSTLTVTVEPLLETGPTPPSLFVRFDLQDEQTESIAAGDEMIFEAGAQTHARIEQLEQDLQQTKESLQSTVEQLETSNEELQASNEELLAANEELQSTNEELHSVNEELYSVNAEHEQKIHELDEATSDLHNLIRSTDIGTVFVDRELRIRLFTPTAGKIFNLLQQDIGRDIAHITYRVQGDDIVDAIRRVINQEPIPEKKILGPDDRRYQRRVTAYRDQDNKPAGVVVTFVDVTELTEAEERLRAANESLEHRVQERTVELLQAQESLRASEAFTRRWLNETTDGIWDWNLETDEEYFSPSFKALFGYADHELPNHASTWKRLVHPEDLPKVEDAIREHVLHGVLFNISARFRHKDGSIVWVLSRGVAVKGPDGRPLRMVGTHTDISDLKKGEDALRQLNERLEARVAERTRELEEVNRSLAASELQYRNVTETLPQLVWTSDPRGSCDYLGPQWIAYTGRPAAEHIGFGWLNQVHPEDRDRASDAWSESLERGGVFDIEFRIRGKDGCYRWFKVRATPLRDEEGAIIKWFGTNTDIDDLRRSEEYARLSEERFRHVVEFSPNGILLVDKTGTISMANPQAAQLFACKVEDLVGSKVETLVPIALRGQHVHDRNAFHDRMVPRPMGAGRNLTALRRDGTEFPVEIGLQPLTASSGSLVVATIVDISDRIQAERDMQDSLLEKETLLKEIHHRVKNNMQLISSLLRLQSDRVTDPDSLAILQQGQSRVRSLALIHEKLYQSSSLAHIDFKDYLRDLLTIIQSSIGASDPRVATEVSGDDVELGVETGVPLALIVNELVSNSFKYAFPSPRRGRIEVTLRRLRDGGVEISVRDDGVGFPPGFDWKSVSSLGLHLVRILSNQIEATTSARSGDGVEFHIKVPPVETAT